MKQSLHTIGEFLQRGIVSHPLWQFNKTQARDSMHRRFLQRVLRVAHGVGPYSVLSYGVDIPSLTVLLAAWKQTLCDVLVPATGTQEQVPLGTLQRRISLVEKSLLEYNPGKQYSYFYYWQQEPDAAHTTKYMQHIHLLLAWGGEGLFVITQEPYRITFSSIVRLVRGTEESKLSTLTERITHSGFSILALYPVECIFPYVRSAWLDVGVWRVLSLFQYNLLMSPFVTRVGIHFKKV